ncbi:MULTISPECIES: hypothetical protein [Kitasatospora]|uniref:hypothetical protein n=1 Tax=Kitasatospora TaxID=2063 RepID=UPI0012FDEB1D|nr:hypothetical protein [Kitasatospora sp. CB02891]
MSDSEIKTQTPEQLHASAASLAAAVQKHLGTSTPVSAPSGGSAPTTGQRQP